MQIIVSGKQVDVGDSLREHIEARLEDGLSKYLDRIGSVKAVLSREGHQFRVDISGNLGDHSGITINSHASSTDSYAAFDSAADKVEKQLRRYKRRLTNHHKMRASHEETIMQQGIQATDYVIDAKEEEEYEGDSPVVIAENNLQVERLTVSEAVMKLDLADLPVLIFINSANERMNVVYRRKDGHISWVDTVEALHQAA